MAQTIGRGGTITLDAFCRDGTNALVDPTTPQVSIIDAEGSTVVSLAIPTRVGLGHFQYEYAVAADALLGAWAARWFGIVNGGGVEDEDGFTVVPAGSISGGGSSPALLASVEDFAVFLDLPAGAINEAKATEMLEGASDLVRDEIGQSLDYIADDVWIARPNGGLLLLLPQLPVIDVTLVEERHDPADGYATLTADVDYEVDLFDGTIHRRGRHVFSTGSGLTGRQNGWPGSVFPRHAGGLVRVTYSHGFAIGPDVPDGVEPLPGSIATVAKRVAARGYENPEAVAQDTVGKVTTSYGAAPGLYLSAGDKASLARLRPGGSGGSH